MSTIKISDLSPAGYDLFSDSESYMNELGDGEIGNIQGGKWSGWRCVLTIVSSGLLGPVSVTVTVWAATSSKIKA